MYFQNIFYIYLHLVIYKKGLECCIRFARSRASQDEGIHFQYDFVDKLIDVIKTKLKMFLKLSNLLYYNIVLKVSYYHMSHGFKKLCTPFWRNEKCNCYYRYSLWYCKTNKPLALRYELEQNYHFFKFTVSWMKSIIAKSKLKLILRIWIHWNSYSV